MDSAGKIAHLCQEILKEIKVGEFSPRDLEFLLSFFNRIVEATEKLLEKATRME